MLTYYLVSVGILFIYATLLFLLGSIKKNNSIIDAFYGPLFILTGITLVGISYLNDYSLSTSTLSILFLIAIWGTRLGLRIYRKNRGKEEDFRYKNWRDLWMKRGVAYFFIRSYFQIYLLQGFIISIVLLPFTLSLVPQSPFSSIAYFGALVWVLGFFFESVGDFQLDRFIQDKNPLKGTIMQSGLWKYTRHPNYFGESMMWWGLAFIAFTVSSSVIVFLSPLLITYLLLFVSGIPMLEKKWAGNPEWEAYKKQTSAFIPLPPTKVEIKHVR